VVEIVASQRKWKSKIDENEKAGLDLQDTMVVGLQSFVRSINRIRCYRNLLKNVQFELLQTAADTAPV